MNKEERSLLLYLETCAVDQGGSVESLRMNAEDFDILTRWAENGFVQFGRIYSRDVTRLAKMSSRRPTNWVELSEEAWNAAHSERRARSKRMAGGRSWLKTDEANNG
jgi:hypothetical protein